MQIGGHDIIFELGHADSVRRVWAVHVAAKAVITRWNSAVFQDGVTGEVYDSLASVPAQTMELLIYRSETARKNWDRLGGVQANQDSMFHILVDEKELTVVVGAPEEKYAREVLAKLRKVFG
jgi:hypothetical protein